LEIGRTPEKITEFTPENMNPMTTLNYEEMGKFPQPKWIAFFAGLDSVHKVPILGGGPPAFRAAFF